MGNAVYSARLVPPRGLEPLSSTFAASCPILERWQVNRSQPMESNHHVRGYGPRRCPARAAGQGRGDEARWLILEISERGARQPCFCGPWYPWRESHPRCRLERPEYSLLYDTDLHTLEGAASVTGIEPVLSVGKTEVLGRCTTRTKTNNTSRDRLGSNQRPSG